MSVLHQAWLLKLVTERALAVMQGRRRERWLAKPDERPPGTTEDER